MIKSRRIIQPNVIIGDSYDRNLNQHSWVTSQTYGYDEVTDTTNHPGWFRQDDAGGYFANTTSEWRQHMSPSVRVSGTSGGSNPFLSYIGSFATGVPAAMLPIGDGSAWGASAYASMKPTKFDYSLVNMVYELKDLGHMFLSLRNFWKFQAESLQATLRQGSNRFLEHQFGWFPLVNDVMTLIEKQEKISKRIRWLIRNQGKWVWRNITIRDTYATTTGDWISNYGALNPILTTQHYISMPQYRDTVFKRDKIWASAQFKYFLPEVPVWDNLEIVVKRSLQGFHSVRLDELYRMIPWTWLFDWCMNFAQVLQNCDPGVADRIAARRFYIMRRQSNTQTRHAKGVFREYGTGNPVEVHATSWRQDVRKNRVRGLPFMVGNPNDLSAMQLAILGALGGSKLQ